MMIVCVAIIVDWLNRIVLSDVLPSALRFMTIECQHWHVSDLMQLSSSTSLRSLCLTSPPYPSVTLSPYHSPSYLSPFPWFYFHSRIFYSHSACSYPMLVLAIPLYAITWQPTISASLQGHHISMTRSSSRLCSMATISSRSTTIDMISTVHAINSGLLTAIWSALRLSHWDCWLLFAFCRYCSCALACWRRGHHSV